MSQIHFFFTSKYMNYELIKCKKWQQFPCSVFLLIVSDCKDAEPHRTHLKQHPPTHTTPITGPPSAMCCGSWSAPSEEEEEEEGAAGHEQGRRWRPIENQCSRSVSAPHRAKHAFRQLPQTCASGPLHESHTSHSERLSAAGQLLPSLPAGEAEFCTKQFGTNI